MDADNVFETRTLFQIGNYQGAINAGQSLNLKTERERTERDVLVYRSYVAQGNYDIVLSEISPSNPSHDLQAVRLLATYLSDSSSKSNVVSTIQQWMSENATAGNSTVQIISGLVYSHELTFDEALRVLHQNNTLEGHALTTQILIRIDRLDLAEKELAVMKSIDEDATISQLTQAWLNIALGGEKPQEAYYIFKEMEMKYTGTPLLLNGRAVACMHLKKWEEAERLLLDSSEKNPKDPDTIANLITCYTHTKKPQEVINRYITQLRTNAPNHPWSVQLKAAEESFERNLSRYAV
eukprot:TRINITY_DN15569_c0_g1_i1.p1 TRINITY_DN15569_c0_g1~~TRINITY_DN15569_c0_g1_i1.p1  ORF type:complete len:295 (+),score=68.67 TRINITY_DN15569_c0_g1_i1:763-1647(+)